MSLKEYRAKRNFKESPEPKGKRKSSSEGNFVIHKHAARHLHYDVRLEFEGKLLSWAVPKKPSGYEKRLAIQVEDHPLEYQYFEGTIPKGSYGAGTVEIWDHGTYTSPNLKEGLNKGHFMVTLHGKVLQGDFVFQKLKDAHNWLFFKRAEREEQPKKKIPMPKAISPMLATLSDKPFDDEDWLFEIKWDGYRALAFIDNGDVKLKSRSNRLFKYPELVKELEKIEGQLILDGEIVVLDEEGKSHFQLLQNYKKGLLYYYVFDLLYQDGVDLRERPLLDRKELLKDLLSNYKLSHVRFSDHLVGKGNILFSEASKRHLEGIIGKKLSSPYQTRRSRDWIKIKAVQKQKFVIGGFTAPKGSRKWFGALLVGIYDKKQLKFAGKVGGGFDAALLKEVYEKLVPQKQCPFKEAPKEKNVTWVKPEVECEVIFSEWTKEGLLRHPIFQGLLSKSVPTTNREKIFWPKEKYSKGDLLDYYESIAPYILPYLKNRPITLYRFPEGISKPGFYQKDIETPPKGIKTFPIRQEGKTIHYLLIDSVTSLLYAINLGSIDLHPFMARCKDLDHPDYCVIDFDPHGVTFKRVVEVVQATHELLEEWKIPHLYKTSGGKGMHLFIPLGGKYTFEQSRNFATLIAFAIHKQFPKLTSLERNPKKREKKIYLDCLQNREGQTIVAPYAVRPRPHALVSTPLEWKEVKEGLDPNDFTIKTVPERVKKRGDLFKMVLGKGINMKEALKRLELGSSRP